MEAIQFRDWRPWHAVRPEPEENRTFCGIKVLGAKRMWQKWDEQTHRCKQCEAALRSGVAHLREHLKAAHNLNLDRPATLEVLQTIHSAQHAGEQMIDAEEIERVVAALTPEELAEIEATGEDNMAWAARMLKRMEKG